MARRVAMVMVVAVVILAGAVAYWVETRDQHSSTAAAAPSKGTVQPSAARPASPHDPDEKVSRSSKRKEANKESPGELSPFPDRPEGPLHSGEVLEFSANVSKLNNVANLKLQIAERKTFLGKPAWHLQAFARTENPLRMLFALDDQFDSYSDASSLTSLQYEMHLNERGQQVTSVQRMTVTGREPTSQGASETRVLPGTRDPLGMMQYLRTVDWTKTPEVRGPVYDGHKLYEARAALQGSENVAVPAGNYRASKISVRVFDNGAELKDASFALYLAQDGARTPVLLEALLPFASARVELTKAR